MKKVFFILLNLFSVAYAQEWVWSKFYANHFIENSGGYYFRYHSNDSALLNKTIIMHFDSSENMIDSVHFNKITGWFRVDNSGNFIFYWVYSDSFSYSGTTIHSFGQKDEFILKLSPDGNLIFLKSIGAAPWDNPISVSFDSNDKIYISKDISNTIYFDNDSIVPDENYQEIALIVFNPDGSLHKKKKVNMTANGCRCDYSARNIFFGKNGDIFLRSEFNSQGDDTDYITKFNSDLDSVDRFLGFTVDETGENSYFVTNLDGHYGYKPELNKLRLSDKKVLWKTELGGMYDYFELRPVLLPGNVILAYGRGGNSFFNDPGTAVIEDTILYFDGPEEMLFALLDTSGHFYYIKNEKVHGTQFHGASYDDHGNAYLISAWGKDTNYTMGTSFNSADGNLVIN